MSVNILNHWLYNLYSFLFGISPRLINCLPVMVYTVPSWYTGYAVTVVSSEICTSKFSIYTVVMISVLLI